MWCIVRNATCYPTWTALKFSIDMQNPLAVTSDKLGGQRAVIFDRGRRID